MVIAIIVSPEFFRCFDPVLEIKNYPDFSFKPRVDKELNILN
ncbi:hypothetical protein GM3709_1175 [Geminocystis sp. NIES-3709]|nr:hypothetical protein GM3709_1175 [Geminocystis sp. NIES-3709]